MERWVMNRLGFVNFWVYDVEEFPLKDGKLLLRGSNGSGKSITTQSFIPYILDGDRQPSRLDPFGSKDRKMSFYLLGDPENEKEESTGYLYLEFVKPESRQYRTIGIGLHAKKGGKMNTWGFCLLDGRRIGFDFFLYREAENKNIPLDSKRLKNELGEKNIYVEKNSDYKEMVAKHIFGIDPENISDFDQLTNILIKTRSSKLASKENLKPAQLYEILNESLCTLSDEDLRPMADAMSKIEDSHEKIEDAVKALNEIKYISAEYDRYNRYMLWKKASLYLEKYSELLKTEKRCNELKIQLDETLKLRSDSIDKLEVSEIRSEDLEREEKNLDLNDIKEQMNKRTEAKTLLDKNKDFANLKRENINRKREKADKQYRKLKDEKNELEDHEYHLKEYMDDYDTYEEYEFPLYDNYKKQIAENKNFYKQSMQCRSECEEHRKLLRNAIKTIEERDRRKELLDDAERAFDDAKYAEKQAEDELKKAQKTLDENKDILIEAYYLAGKNNTEFIIDDELIKNIESAVSGFEGSGSANILNKFLSENKLFLSGKLRELKLNLENDEKILKEKYDLKAAELKKLKETPEPVPERTKLRENARKKLSENGIVCRSFYECIDFEDGLDDDKKALVEAELIDMGILDSLVVPAEYYDKAAKILGEISDCIIVPGSSSLSGNKKMLIPACSDEFEDITQKIINSLECIGEDGFYRNGILYGHSVAAENARYIGAQNRKIYRLKQIELLEAETEKAKSEYENSGEAVEAAKKRIDKLDEEYAQLPSTDDINTSCNLLESAALKHEKALKYTENEEKKFAEERLKYEKASREAEKCCKPFPYKKIFEEYEEAADAFDDFASNLHNIISCLGLKNTCLENISLIKEQIEEAEDDIDRAESELKRIMADIHEAEEIIRLCEEFLNSSENRNKFERANEIKNEMEILKSDIAKCGKTIAGCDAKAEIIEGQINEASADIERITSEENVFAEYFLEELALRYVIDEPDLTVEKYAKKAVLAISEGDERKSISEIQSRLENSYRKHSVILSAEYAPIYDTYFEDSGPDSVRTRIHITLSWRGKRISPLAFEKEITETIEHDRLLVKQDEERMFKEILLNTISKKLYYRIDESRKWIDSMASLMQNINTSMGLSFSLSWKPKKDTGENELEFDELSRILTKSKELIDPEDFEKLSAHFRSRIEQERKNAEEQENEINYSELVKNVLDFRNWFEFRLHFRQGSSGKYSELTNSRFNTFSGGERALSLYIPLFAAVAAQYRKAGEQAPMILALDEAFAGVDDSNISEMFGLLEKLHFGYIVNSQALWGCYDTVPALEIAELFHDKGSSMITVILYEWNGKQKKLAE